MALDAEAGQVPAKETKPLMKWLEHFREGMVAENAERRHSIVPRFIASAARMREDGANETDPDRCREPQSHGRGRPLQY